MKLANKAQEEQLKEVVAHLRQAREERSVRVEELAAYTRIRLAFLYALEEGRFEELPEPIYVQGFIRHYADALGLDGTALAQSVANICSPPEPEHDNQALEKKPDLHIPLVVPYVLLLTAASFGLFYILHPQRPSESSQKTISQLAASEQKSEQKTVAVAKPSSIAESTPTPTIASPTTEPAFPIIAPTAETATPATPTPISIPTTSPSGEVRSTVTAPTPEVSSLATPTPTSTTSPSGVINSPLEVSIELQDQSWLRVKVDGRTEFEGILNKGERKSWTAQKELIIRSGNAGAVLVSANKKEPTPLGDMGSVKQVLYTPEIINNQ